MSKHKLTKKQEKAILKIKDYFEKRLSSSNERLPNYCESAIDILKRVYIEGEYDYGTKIVLNSYRDNYYKDLKEFGKDFKGMELPFGPKVTVI
jgi:hypothetical protein